MTRILAIFASWRLWKFGVLIAVVYAIACLAFYCLQEHELFPCRCTQGQTYAVVRPSPEYELVRLTTSEGVAIVSLFGRALDAQDRVLPDAAYRPTLLFFYGNGTILANGFADFRRFRRLGVNVMMPEYPGYGMSGGVASEQSFYDCADAAFNYLRNRPDVEGAQIVAAGWSIGAAVATNLAARRPVMCLATFSAFTSWNQEMRVHFGWLPTSLLIRAHFDNESKFTALRCPVFIAHGSHDRVVPFAMCKRLAAARGSGLAPVKINSDHADIFDAGGDKLMHDLARFIDACRASQTGVTIPATGGS